MLGSLLELDVSEWKNYVGKAVVGVFDETSMVCYVEHYESVSNGMLKLMKRVIENDVYVLRTDDALVNYDALKVRLVAYGDHIDYLCGYPKVVGSLENAGYRVLNKRDIPRATLKIKYRRGKDGRVYYVVIESSRSIKSVVGVFSSLSQCDEFVTTHYPKGVLNEKIVATNLETQEYMMRYPDGKLTLGKGKSRDVSYKIAEFGGLNDRS